MTAPRIQSHSDPRLMLGQHVAEIVAASDALLGQMGDAGFRREGGDALVADLAALHDTGKASAAFQGYIAAPRAWKGKAIEKAHTPLSLVLAALYGRALGWPAPRAIATALAVRGHHGGQASEGEELRRGLADDLVDAALRAQIPSLDLAQIEAETGVRLAPVGDLDDALDDAGDALEDWLDAWRALPRDPMVRARFLARAAYSILLEADKAFLAVDPATRGDYLQRTRVPLPAALVDATLAAVDPTPMSALRERARVAAAEGFARHRDAPLLTLTLPTGAGKTLVAARWALEERERSASAVDTPTVILALPMLSIVDQTEQVWRKLLGAPKDDGETLLPYHSLSDRVYDPELEGSTADFFIDTWRSEVVVTTFDQILLALYSDRAKHAMRYHRLLNARIVIDEVQCVPPVLWTALEEGLRALTTLGRTRVLAMSATPSPCLGGAATEALADPGALYADLARYEIHLAHERSVDFDTFIADTTRRCRDAISRGEGTLVTVNVRATAQETRERLSAAGLAPMLLSGDMTPEHRLRVIAEIKADPVRVVVSTQCVEAGVDLDMHHVIRDLAPLDALVQIAGRCNRHAHRKEPGTVSVVHLRNPWNGGDDARAIYDEVLLQCTEETLHGRGVVSEREVLGLCLGYFERVAERKYRGGDDFDRWAQIKNALEVRKMLRGEDDDQEQVLVLEGQAALKSEILAALRVADRWERRNALRALSARLARITVSVSGRVFQRLVTSPIGPWHELAPGQYDRVFGIDSRRRA